MNEEPLIVVENLGKKFCKSLKRSLYYGTHDIIKAINPFAGSGASAQSTIPELRKDEFWALQNINFELRRGECLGLIGHNGAGKSTLLKVINGLIKPDTGKITIRGRVCALIELGAGFSPILTGRENIYNQGALYGLSKADIDEKIEDIIEFSEIREFIDMPVQNYSSGMKVRLGFAVATKIEPDVLILDEVLAVGDVAFRMKSLNAICEKMKRTAVIFVSHSMPQIHRVCNEVLVMNHGKSEYQGNDISEGVSRYLALLNNIDQQVFGGSDLNVIDIQVQNSTGQINKGETLECDHGDDLKARLTIGVSGTITEFRAQLVIWNSELLPVVDIMCEEFNGQPVQTNGQGEVVISVDINNLELNGGKYAISVHLNSMDFSQSYCRHDNVAFLNVKSVASTHALVLKPCSWRQE